MHAKPALASGLFAMLLTSAAPAPAGPQTRIVPPPPPADTSPVKCRLGQPDDQAQNVVVTSNSRISRSLRNPQRFTKSGPQPIPAPPPPPPPPMVAPAPMAGLVASPSYAAPYGSAQNTERYAGKDVAAIQSVAAAPVSTFSIDVDTGAYANVRRFLNKGGLPPAEAVRTEELINYFRYDYPRPTNAAEPFSVTTDVARTPWNPNTRLLRIGLRGDEIAAADRPRANLVFLIDVSGSMDEPDKLPLVKAALTTLAERLRADDRVSIVVYAGAAGVVLEPTANKGYVKTALDCLQAGGSTAGGAGLKMAYDLTRANFVKGGINRIFLATDGDFNVGVSDNTALEAMVKAEREDGITLTTLGFGQGNYNEAMMERIADVGNGNYAYIDSAMEAEKVLDEELSSTLVTIAKDVKIQVEFNPAAVKEYRLIGYENRALAEQDFANDSVDAGDMGAGHQVTALYEVVPADGPGWLPDRRYAPTKAKAPVGAGEMCQVKLRYKLPNGTTSTEMRRIVPAGLLRSATAPTGDMAFVTAVAAFGQKLRGDTYLGTYGFSDTVKLAGSPTGYWRSEFVKLAQMAGSRSPVGMPN